ncbi:uncharacterized protein [Diadema setosum]|uniref:uncharacterized protein n=1 Tax=Diadema setosum TaxID=31175 RepID=UPI003B3BB737
MRQMTGGLALNATHFTACKSLSPTTTNQGVELSQKETSTAKGVMAVVGRSAMSKELMSSYSHTKRVGPYLLGRTIGEGSFAKVKEAMHVLVGEKVAIKVIDKIAARKDPYLNKTLRREAGLLQLLGHPNIVRLLETMETDNNLYMVMELCEGGPLLDKVCERGGLEEGLAGRYIKQVVSAVHHMHQMGVMHRDLKVENLLLDDDDNVKIIDFGLNLFGIEDFAGTLCGSPAYAAPEIIARKRYGPKVDVWSIGVNTFAILTGTLPFVVEPFSLHQLLKKILKGDLGRLPPRLSSDCKNFVRTLLQPDPKKRPTIDEVLCHPWLAGSFKPLHSLISDPATPTPPSTPCSSVSPRRVSRMLLDHDVIKEIKENFGIKSSLVSDSVLTGRADEFSAIYYLLLNRRAHEDVRKIRGRLRENWETFRACSRNDRRVDEEVEAERDVKDSTVPHSDTKPGEQTTKTESGDDYHRMTNIDDFSSEGENIVAEETAWQIAGKRQGSFHFKMAMVIEEEAEKMNKMTADRPSPPPTRRQIYREVLDDDLTTAPMANTPTEARLDGQVVTKNQGIGNKFHSRGNQLKSNSGNPWIILLGRETTDSFGKGSRVLKNNSNLAGVTTACFKGNHVKTDDCEIGKGKRPKETLVPVSVSDEGRPRQRAVGLTRRNTTDGRTPGRLPLSSKRPVHLTFPQSQNFSRTTFASHFRQTFADRPLKQSNLKYPIPRKNEGTVLSHANEGNVRGGQKGVTFKNPKPQNRFRTNAAISGQPEMAAKACDTLGSDRRERGEHRKQRHEEAVKVFRMTRRTSTVPREFIALRKRRSSLHSKRKETKRCPVTVTPKSNVPTRGNGPLLKTNVKVTLAGRPSTSSIEEERKIQEKAVVSITKSCSRAEQNRSNRPNSKQDGNGDQPQMPRRFSVSDEGYDTNHSLEGETATQKKLPDMALPMVSKAHTLPSCGRFGKFEDVAFSPSCAIID